MAIFKDVTDPENEARKVTLINMGYGDVEILSTGKAIYGSAALALKTVEEPRPVGTCNPSPYNKISDMEPEIVFIFSSAESVSVLIEALEECRAAMQTTNTTT